MILIVFRFTGWRWIANSSTGTINVIGSTVNYNGAALAAADSQTAALVSLTLQTASFGQRSKPGGGLLILTLAR